MNHRINADLSKIKFKEDGLAPVVIQDAFNKEILMVAYMNHESLSLSLKTGETHFWSRSRKTLWRKGETSGHIQKIKQIFVDCDEDTLLIQVEQVDAACHTGARSCFYQTLTSEGQLTPSHGNPDQPEAARPSVLETLSQTIMGRKQSPANKSYTSLLFQGGIDRILKKVAEESGELIIGAKNGGREELVHETADLLYHVLVTLAFYDIPFSAIETELQRRTTRSGLDEKASRKPMKETPTNSKTDTSD